MAKLWSIRSHTKWLLAGRSPLSRRSIMWQSKEVIKCSGHISEDQNGRAVSRSAEGWGRRYRDRSVYGHRYKEYYEILCLHRRYEEVITSRGTTPNIVRAREDKFLWWPGLYLALLVVEFLKCDERFFGVTSLDATIHLFLKQQFCGGKLLILLKATPTQMEQFNVLFFN